MIITFTHSDNWLTNCEMKWLKFVYHKWIYTPHRYAGMNVVLLHFIINSSWCLGKCSYKKKKNTFKSRRKWYGVVYVHVPHYVYVWSDNENYLSGPMFVIELCAV